MSDHVMWIVDMTIGEGKLADLKALASEMTEATKKNEPGALNYEWSISEDGKRLNIYERYANLAAVQAHMGNVGPTHIPRLMSMGTVNSFTVYSKATPELRAVLANAHPTYMQDVAGFTR